jgi:hypothetical protein
VFDYHHEFHKKISFTQVGSRVFDRLTRLYLHVERGVAKSTSRNFILKIFLGVGNALTFSVTVSRKSMVPATTMSSGQNDTNIRSTPSKNPW